MLIRYLFRKPKFPLICDVHGLLIGAETPGEFVKQVGAGNMPLGKYLPIVDATGEGWAFHTTYMVISPLTIKKRWTKKEVIDMFNRSITARQVGLEYAAKSLSSKRLDQIIKEIAALIKKANKAIHRLAGKSGSQ
jgi:hypothetical protein